MYLHIYASISIIVCGRILLRYVVDFQTTADTIRGVSPDSANAPDQGDKLNQSMKKEKESKDKETKDAKDVKQEVKLSEDTDKSMQEGSLRFIICFVITCSEFLKVIFFG